VRTLRVRCVLKLIDERGEHLNKGLRDESPTVIPKIYRHFVSLSGPTRFLPGILPSGVLFVKSFAPSEGGSRHHSSEASIAGHEEP